MNKHIAVIKSRAEAEKAQATADHDATIKGIESKSKAVSVMEYATGLANKKYNGIVAEIDAKAKQEELACLAEKDQATKEYNTAVRRNSSVNKNCGDTAVAAKKRTVYVTTGSKSRKYVIRQGIDA